MICLKHKTWKGKGICEACKLKEENIQLQKEFGKLRLERDAYLYDYKEKCEQHANLVDKYNCLSEKINLSGIDLSDKDLRIKKECIRGLLKPILTEISGEIMKRHYSQMPASLAEYERMSAGQRARAACAYAANNGSNIFGRLSGALGALRS